MIVNYNVMTELQPLTMNSHPSLYDSPTLIVVEIKFHWKQEELNKANDNEAISSDFYRTLMRLLLTEVSSYFKEHPSHIDFKKQIELTNLKHRELNDSNS